MSDIVTPKVEKVEYWTFVSRSGATATYQIRPEIGETGSVSVNQIDGTPVEVILAFRAGDDKNELVGSMRFPVVNLFSYGKSFGTQTLYPEGKSPAEQELRKMQEQRESTLLKRRQRNAALQEGLDPRPSDFDTRIAR